MKVCPADWMEGIAMVVSGGIYCQYKQAEYILDDLKAEVQRIRAQGEAERDALIKEYASASTQQQAFYDVQIKALQNKLHDLLARANELLQKAGNQNATLKSKSTLSLGESSKEFLKGNRLASSLRKEDTVDARSMAKTMIPADTPLVQLGKEVQQQIEESKTTTDAQVSGPFTSAGQALDQLARQAIDEINKGFDSQFTKPLIAMVAGLPPPDPLTLVVIMNASKLELLRVWNAKNAWLAGLRAHKDVELEASAEENREAFQRVMEKLQMALKQAMALIKALQEALDKPGKDSQDALATAISQVRTEKTTPNPKAVLQLPDVPKARWSRILVPTTSLDAAIQAAVRVAETPVPLRATPAALSTLTASTRSTLRNRVASTSTAQVEAELRARFAAEPDTLRKVVDWLKAEASQPS